VVWCPALDAGILGTFGTRNPLGHRNVHVAQKATAVKNPPDLVYDRICNNKLFYSLGLKTKASLSSCENIQISNPGSWMLGALTVEVGTSKCIIMTGCLSFILTGFNLEA
jgi:hypothetical protein